jgi:hypothetical protein
MRGARADGSPEGAAAATGSGAGGLGATGGGAAVAVVAAGSSLRVSSTDQFSLPTRQPVPRIS